MITGYNQSIENQLIKSCLLNISKSIVNQKSKLNVWTRVLKYGNLYTLYYHQSNNIKFMEIEYCIKCILHTDRVYFTNWTLWLSGDIQPILIWNYMNGISDVRTAQCCTVGTKAMQRRIINGISSSQQKPLPRAVSAWWHMRQLPLCFGESVSKNQGLFQKWRLFSAHQFIFEAKRVPEYHICPQGPEKS